MFVVQARIRNEELRNTYRNRRKVDIVLKNKKLRICSVIKTTKGITKDIKGFWRHLYIKARSCVHGIQNSTCKFGKNSLVKAICLVL